MVRIRLAGEPDAEAIAAIYAPFVERTAVSFETTPPGPDEMRRRIAEVGAFYPWLVCELDGRVVGYAYATQHRARAAYRWSVDASAYIEAAHHRRGIGRGLYASLFEILRAQGFFNAFAGITLPNPSSVGLHEAVGFKKIGSYHRVGHKLGTWHDVGWWQLVLQPHSENPGEPVALSNLLARPDWANLLSHGEEVIRETAALQTASSHGAPSTVDWRREMVMGLGTVIYHVTDLSKAKTWYSNAFRQQPYFDEPFYVGFNIAGYELGLDPNQSIGKAGAGGAVAYWRVREIDEALRHFVAAGAPVVAPVQDVGDRIKVATVSDPFGNLIGLIENPHFTLPKDTDAA